MGRAGSQAGHSSVRQQAGPAMCQASCHDVLCVISLTEIHVHQKLFCSSSEAREKFLCTQTLGGDSCLHLVLWVLQSLVISLFFDWLVIHAKLCLFWNSVSDEKIPWAGSEIDSSFCFRVDLLLSGMEGTVQDCGHRHWGWLLGVDRAQTRAWSEGLLCAKWDREGPRAASVCNVHSKFGCCRSRSLLREFILSNVKRKEKMTHNWTNGKLGFFYLLEKQGLYLFLTSRNFYVYNYPRIIYLQCAWPWLC